MIDDNWLALIAWCKKNPYTTIERLEIVDGKPKLLIVKKQLTQHTVARVKVKYDKDGKIFNNQ